MICTPIHIISADFVPPEPPPTTPTVTTANATVITATSATLGGEVTNDGGGTMSERGIVYSVTATNSNPLISGTGVTKDPNGVLVGVFAETISASIDPNVNYSFKAYAINDIGTSYGTLKTFQSAALNSLTLGTTSYGSHALACADTGGTQTLYHNGEGTDPIGSDIIYTNDTGTTIFNGGGNFYKLTSGAGGTLEISAFGVVDTKALCV